MTRGKCVSSIKAGFFLNFSPNFSKQMKVS